MLQTMKRVVAGAALLVGISATAQAQFLTDAGSPLGSGGGVSGAVVNYIGSVGAGGGNAAIAAVLAPSGGAPAVQALTQALGGGAAAGTLAEALATLGATPTPTAARNAMLAYNAAIDAGVSPTSPAMTAARSFFVSLGAK
ncbi:MAG: hypothetical protein KF689_05405 [Gemmatimonadaceae bacterium]|nr:hypothetical protein [Gemmatimonadaceae bacterium]MCW5825391.1 hypothetical protein [Gemmatimonadaceae bacterium]